MRKPNETTGSFMADFKMLVFKKTEREKDFARAQHKVFFIKIFQLNGSDFFSFF